MVSLQQFEAAAGFGGLGLNVGTTEAVGCRIKKAVVPEEVENAMKERISVKVDGVEMDSAGKMESRVGHLRVE